MWQTQTTIKTQQPIMATTITTKDDYKLVCKSFTIHNNFISLLIDSNNIDLNKMIYISRQLQSDLLIESDIYILSIDINTIKSIEY